MPDIDVHRAHNLGLAAARVAAERMAADLAKKFDLKGDWEGNVLHFQRPGVSGSLAITAKDLHIAVTLGFLLKAMKGSIERAVLHELDTLFSEKAPSSPRPSPKGGGEKARSKTAPASRKKGG